MDEKTIRKAKAAIEKVPAIQAAAPHVSKQSSLVLTRRWSDGEA